jgi:hypothetical protein
MCTCWCTMMHDEIHDMMWCGAWCGARDVVRCGAMWLHDKTRCGAYDVDTIEWRLRKAYFEILHSGDWFKVHDVVHGVITIGARCDAQMWCTMWLHDVIFLMWCTMWCMMYCTIMWLVAEGRYCVEHNMMMVVIVHRRTSSKMDLTSKGPHLTRDHIYVRDHI